MAIFTKSEFENISRSRLRSKSMDTILVEVKNLSRYGSKTSVFLSHAHTDKDIVEQAVLLLNSFSVDVYVDWMDETMSDKPDGKTAEKIKQKITLNDKFILLATTAAVGSKWCNWEIGIGDIKKLSSDNMCIIPLADNSTFWNGNEYLQLYPWVEPSNGLFRLHYPGGKSWWFDDWLKK